MNTTARRKRRIIRVMVTGTLIVGLTGALVWSNVSWVNREAALQQRIEVLSSELDQANTRLKAYDTSTEYSSAAAPIYDIPLSKELQEYTYEMCELTGIEEHYPLILGMMWRESHFDAAAVSSTDDYGIMQINKQNHKNLQETLGVDNFLDPYDNIEAGVHIIATLLHKYSDENKALMAYNMGPTGASRQWDRGNYSSFYSRDILSKAQAIETGNYK